jgi:fumarate reductase flavoprotein subunit
MTEEERGGVSQRKSREPSRRSSIAGPGAVGPGGEEFSSPEEAPPPEELLGRRRKDMVPERTYSFETPPEPIPAGNIKETITSEVVVVGAGLAGLNAVTLEP